MSATPNEQIPSRLFRRLREEIRARYPGLPLVEETVLCRETGEPIYKFRLKAPHLGVDGLLALQSELTEMVVSRKADPDMFGRRVIVVSEA